MKVQAIRPLQVKGKVYRKGESLEVDAPTATRLIRSGKAVEGGAVEKPKKRAYKKRVIEAEE